MSHLAVFLVCALSVWYATVFCQKCRYDIPTDAQRRRPVVVVIGASRGLGEETSSQIASRGDRTVIMTARTVESGRAALARAAGRNVHRSSTNNSDHLLLFAPFDIRSEAHREDLAMWIAKYFGRLDSLVCSAGIADKGRLNESTTRKVLATNVFGTAAVIKALIPTLMRSPGSARVVIVASQRGHLGLVSGEALTQVETAAMGPGASVAKVEAVGRAYEALRLLRSDDASTQKSPSLVESGWPEGDVYGVSKLLGVAFAKALANELHNDNVNAVAVCPGWCKTDMGSSMAPRSVSEGAKTISHLACANFSDLEKGAFYRDGASVKW